MNDENRENELLCFDTLEEAFETAEAFGAEQPLVLVTSLWGSYQVFSTDALAHFDNWAFPIGHPEHALCPLERTNAHELAAEIAEDGEYVAVIRVADGYRVLDEYCELPVSIVDAVFPRERCSFCAHDAAANEPGFIGPRYSACASCGERVRARKELFDAISEPVAPELAVEKILGGRSCDFGGAELACSALAALTGEYAWAIPVSDGYRFATEPMLQDSVMHVTGRMVIDELCAPRDEAVDAKIREIANTKGLRVGTIDAGPLVVVLDQTSGFAPDPFRRQTIEPSVTCCECGSEGHDPLTGEAYMVLGRIYCAPCTDHLCDIDPEFEGAFDREL